MTEPEAPIVEILAELRKPGVSLKITRSIRRESVHIIEPSSSYCTLLCLTPRPADSRARYVDAWSATRFEPLGDLSVLPPDHTLEVRGHQQRQVTIICHLAARSISQWFEQEVEWNDRRLSASLHLSNPHIRALLTRLAEEAHRPGLGNEGIVRHIAGQLGIEIARFCESITEVRAIGGLAAWRLRSIDERLKHNGSMPSVEELANLCQLSVRQLSRGFKVSRGVSLQEYCSTIRIERAKRLLAGDDSIQEVAFASGFTSASTFSHAFRMTTGSSPRDFRQRMRRAIDDASSATPILPD